MSASNTRAGAPLVPTTTTAGVPGTSSREVQFQDSRGAGIDVRPCLVTNLEASSGSNLYVKINATGASDSDANVVIAPQTQQDVSQGGIINIQTLSLYYDDGGDDYATAIVAGWNS